MNVVSRREVHFVPVVDEQYLREHSASAEHEQFMRMMQFRSMIVVPLVSGSEGTIGALTFVRSDPLSEPYDETALRFAKNLARHCANAIVKARLYEQTLHIATQYQRAALTERLPDREGITFDAIYEPASKAQLVGGDWYDAFDLPDGRIAITVGDVLGHGVQAATLMSCLRNALRAALFAKPDAAVALEIAEKVLASEYRQEFATGIVALLDPERQTLECASAGHPGPLILYENGELVDPLEDHGVPLGLSDLGPTARAQTVSLPHGSFIVFFTDGLLEWNHDIERAWSELERVIRAPEVRASLHPALAIRQKVVTGDHRGDDVAILTVQSGSTRPAE